MEYQSSFAKYLKALEKPFRKIVRLEFLQPDGSVAFSLGNERENGYMTTRRTQSFIQDGSLSVTLQNGQRRKASVKLANLDNAYSYAVNHIWFGQKLRLKMGMHLPDGSEILFPQGVFYITNPDSVFSPKERTVTYHLVDKFGALDGTVGGMLHDPYFIAQKRNIFMAISDILRLDKYEMKDSTTDKLRMVDSTTPVFTSYYNNLGEVEHKLSDGTVLSIPYTSTAYDITVSAGGKISDVIAELNNNLVAWYGYDQTGAFRVEPSQDEISDAYKPILYSFTPQNSVFCSLSESCKTGELYNDVIVCGQGSKFANYYGRATNYDPKSPANVKKIGLRTLWRNESYLCSEEQCKGYAEWLLKRKTVLPQAITITCQQMFHLLENRLVTVKRTDKEGYPVERHCIQSFTIPIGDTGSMSISATSVEDYPAITTVVNYGNGG